MRGGLTQEHDDLKGANAMTHDRILNPLEKALRFYAVFALAVMLFQGLGLGMYLVNVWPGVRSTFSTSVTTFVGLAVVLGFTRSGVWILVYWKGATALSMLRRDGASPGLADRLTPVLAMLTRLLVVSCVLDFCFLPAFFLADRFLPFTVSGWRLGLVELARLLLPQAFGLAALVLAFLTHQYGVLLRERGELKQELELTI